jgi:hypothetical protein
MDREETFAAIRRHLSTFFAGHRIEEHYWTVGPDRVLDAMADFRVAEIAPGPVTGLWVYASIGTWEARADPRLEFILVAPEQDLRQVELVTMIAWYHRTDGLGIGHTLPIGEPWLPGSKCDHFLVSLPFPFGPKLEECNFQDWHLHYLWLLPITKAEREFKVKEGQEALEERFDDVALEYWKPDRASVV